MSASKFSGLLETEPARPGLSPVYRPAYAPDGAPSLGVTTLREMFENSVNLYPHSPCLGWRVPGEGGAPPSDYQWMTYKETSNAVDALHSAFESLGLGVRDRVGIIGINCPEWMISMQALNRMDGVCVPLYDTLGDAAVGYVVQHAECKLVMAQGAKLPLVATLMTKGGCSSVASVGVGYWGDASADAIKVLTDAGINVYSWAELLEKGKAKPVPARPSKAEDTCTIMYTSGTTGNPKGVVVSHQAVLATISGLKHFVAQMHEDLTENDVYMSYLTLAHIFDRVGQELMLQMGASIGYWQGDPKKLMDDLAALRPTIFPSVPRVLERVYNGVQDQLKKGGSLKRAVFNLAYQNKLAFMSRNLHWGGYLSDWLVFHNIKARLGGRVRILLSGGAPCPAHVEEFLKITSCALVAQGYGLTESTAASFISNPYQWGHTFTVGPPMPHTELRLEAVPEMGYDPASDPPRGEVCIRSPSLFTGYYKEPEMTKEVMDADGFFHTGDIGEITPSGALRLIDRKKNIFKLSHGEYIAVERVENVYKQCQLVEQLWVYGNSFESCLVAVLVPREHALRELAAQQGVPDAATLGFKELLQVDAVKTAVLTDLKAVGRANKLKGFEEVKSIHLEPEHFAVENDLMTPSFKLKRPQLLKHYQQVVDAMYAELKKAGAA